MSQSRTVADSLTSRGIKKTPFRLELLGLFFEHENGLSHQEIKERVKSTKDKVTIYRALDSFLSSGLIHKVPGTNNVTKYALCPPTCSEESHEHHHVHFVCQDCQRTYCLADTDVPGVKTPKGFQIQTANLTLEGTCADCAKAL